MSLSTSFTLARRLGLGALFGFAALSAHAQVIGSFRSTPDLSLLEETSFGVDFVAEARWGNRQLNGTFEYDLHDVAGTSGAPISGQATWTNGTATSFELSYTSSSRLIEWRIGSRPFLTATLPNGTQFADVIIRGAALTENAITSFVEIDNLKLSVGGGAFQTISGGPNPWATSPNNGGTGRGLLFLNDVVTAASDFDLIGDLTFNWSGNPSLLQSQLAMQIKVGGEMTPVPEPSTYGLMGAAALVGLVAWRRRKTRT